MDTPDPDLTHEQGAYLGFGVDPYTPAALLPLVTHSLG